VKEADPAPATAPDLEAAVPPPGPLAPDPMFDKHVAIGELLVAVQTQDANLMADLAVQLAAVEKRYARTHRSGVKAEHLFASAVNMAVARRDEPTLNRLAVLLEARQDKAALERLQTLRATLKGSRAADPLAKLVEKLPEETGRPRRPTILPGRAPIS